MTRQLHEMLKQGIVQESKSPFSSPVILVKKADGSQRFVVDYRTLNSMTVKFTLSSLLRIDYALDTLYDTNMYTRLLASKIR